ncbi:MAG: FAD-binding protein [Pseudomonadales bacterium]|nr:FAD-binding protein [Pseudomonadales bacterium]
MINLYENLTTQFNKLEFKKEHLLANYTTVKIGGPAEVFCETKNSQDFVKLISYSIKEKIPFTILGWGANVLISDKGIRGLVIKNNSNNIQVIENSNKVTDETEDQTNDQTTKKTTNESINIKDINHKSGVLKSRWHSDKVKGTFKYEFSDLDYDESNYPTVIVEVDSGVALPVAINTLIGRGITGLQWYSRIPATIGGAIYNNIHGGTHFISEVIESVKIIDENGKIKILPKNKLKIGYDKSRFHSNNEIIVSARLKLFKGDKIMAANVAKEWAIRKAIQPKKSLGCIFQNLTENQKNSLNYPTSSVGYIVEHILNKKGYRIGDVKISENHAAFLENVGNATAKDYLELIRKIIEETKNIAGIKLKPEIFFLGFEESELKGITH